MRVSAPRILLGLLWVALLVVFVRWWQTDGQGVAYPRPVANEKGCHDLDGNCPSWGLKGECEKNPKFMMRACAATCDKNCQALPKDELMYGVEKSSNQMVTAMSKRNREQKIYNKEKFGDLDWESESLVVLVIMVHRRHLYLKNLLNSLREVRGIEKSLLIISQDYYTPELDAVLDTIDFCLVMRIFLPASSFLHPKEFPGTDPRDCPVYRSDGSWFSPQEAKRINCLNADTPDMYKHYRDPRFTSIKHHWWWKLAFVFQNVNVLRNHPGFKIFLEEDHYVRNDILEVAAHMRTVFSTSCQTCHLFSLGGYDPPRGSDDAAVVNMWTSKNNMGMGFNSSTWKQLAACASEFCNFDDYNWDITLLHLSHRNCFPNSRQGLEVITPVNPRIFHVGSCGIHQNNKREDCNPGKSLPSGFSNGPPIKGFNVRRANDWAKDPNPNGGWGDPRDRNLCIKFAQTS
eukprot:m.139308 g.139308  ORF g.139308 m.139308 type:complete len:459 (-) comp14796_c0_seq1:213-1589(-)